MLFQEELAASSDFLLMLLKLSNSRNDLVLYEMKINNFIKELWKEKNLETLLIK